MDHTVRENNHRVYLLLLADWLADRLGWIAAAKQYSSDETEEQDEQDVVSYPG